MALGQVQIMLCFLTYQNSISVQNTLQSFSEAARCHIIHQKAEARYNARNSKVVVVISFEPVTVSGEKN